MSNPSKNKISKKIENFFYFERERLIRMPGYKEALDKYNTLFTEKEDLVANSYSYSLDGKMKENEGVKERLVKVNMEIDEILKQYRTTYMIDPDNADDLGWMRAYNGAVNLKGDLVIIAGEGPTTERHKIFKVDIWMDKEIIFHELSDWIDKEKRDSELTSKSKGIKSKDLKIMKRRFAVFDFRSQKPPLAYRNIVLKLLDLYGKRDPKKSLNLARRDYQEAFEIIYGIPYKEHKKEEVDPANLKLCDTCPKKPTCKALCSDMEYYLSKNEVKQAHLISGKRDATEWESGKRDVAEWE